MIPSWMGSGHLDVTISTRSRDTYAEHENCAEIRRTQGGITVTEKGFEAFLGLLRKRLAKEGECRATILRMIQF